MDDFPPSRPARALSVADGGDHLAGLPVMLKYGNFGDDMTVRGSQRRLVVTVTAPAVCLLTAVTACSSAPQPPAASALDSSSPLTCPEGPRDCTSPGTVRWSVPLAGSTPFDIETGTANLNVPTTPLGIELGLPGYLANTIVASGLLVFQRGPLIEAVDLRTGHRRWSTRLPVPSQPGGHQAPGQPAMSAPMPGSTLSMTLAAAQGLITASVGFSWWLLDAATGALIPPTADSPPTGWPAPPPGSWPALAVLPLSPRSVVLLKTPLAEDVDPVTGSVRWRVPLRPWLGYALIGNVLYAGNVGGHPVRTTAIQRIDLASGRAQPALRLPTDLQGLGFRVVQSAQDPDALLVAGYRWVAARLMDSEVIARLDPATSRVIWTRTLPFGAVGLDLQPGPVAAVPSAEFLVPPIPPLLPGQPRQPLPPSGGLQDPPLPPPGPLPPPARDGAIWHILVVSLGTGQATSIPLGPAFPYAAAGIHTWSADGSWDLYGNAMLATASTRPRPAGRGGFAYTRLEGVEPRTGHVLWRGPWGVDLYVLGETFSGPPLIIAESCAPAGLVPDRSAVNGNEAFCDSERLYAVNT